MPDYLIFGNCLRSELSFPELVIARGHQPRWTLRLGTLTTLDDGEVLSDSQLSSTCRIKISQRGTRLRFYHSCSGTFEMSADGSDIVFDAANATNADIARTDLVARLLLTFADHDRVTWLHGSAVMIDGQAVAFVGPSGAGKSTLALALARNGAGHICDDTLPIEGGSPPVVWPSDQTIRLHPDSKSYLAGDTEAARRESDGKFILTHEALGADAAGHGSLLGRARIPLAAVYLLADAEGARSAAGRSAARCAIEPRLAIAALLRHLRLGTVIDRGFGSKAMKQLARVLAFVPVYALDLTHEWSAIDDVARQIIAWHSTSGVDPEVRQTA